MATRPGGETPASYGLTTTCETPTGTSVTTPVEIGQILKLSTAVAYKLVASADGDIIGGNVAVLVRAEERSTDVKPIGVRVLGKFQSILRLKYTGTTPTLGQSILADATGNVKAVSYNGNAFVLFVDTAKTEVEVLI